MSVESIKARLAAATNSPWSEIRMEHLGLSVICNAVMEGDEVAAYETVMAGTHITAEADADLIAHAPTDLALLLAVVEHAKRDHYLTEHFLRGDDQYISVPGCACPFGADLLPCPTLDALNELETAP